MSKQEILNTRINEEVSDFIASRKSLMLSSIQPDGTPYASYAPFAIGDDCLYVLLSEIALHAVNLQHNPAASVLIIEDEDSAGELFARKRVNYSMQAALIELESEAWYQGIDILEARHGERIRNLSQLADFRLFRLSPEGGRFVKGFGRAFTLAGNSLAGEEVSHMRDGHKKRDDIKA
ncbi:HugZ family pyridoxamine 5'-phosphate oxidase [Oceanospirillum sediminis]|uniref:Pyridoxamine 5'-phosphate oxidase family protein n=1 Tax=Oceanospirillum sediminis TaxID=2760088 RepID=A0A839IQF1_9GAMM|nr:pyridoxamine 5'-phosphate oxidase family protein [Oceanospirillum sediminis]MBB1486456.1 pyridoxamine 5'-phosphate oxidase family protein [Oceanospirillum sediminis]